MMCTFKCKTTIAARAESLSADLADLADRADQVDFETLMVGNLAEKSRALSAIFTATLRATAL